MKLSHGRTDRKNGEKVTKSQDRRVTLVDSRFDDYGPDRVSLNIN